MELDKKLILQLKQKHPNKWEELYRCYQDNDKIALTYLNVAMGKSTKKFSSHSSDEILERHYIDQTVVHKAVKKVQIFG